MKKTILFSILFITIHTLSAQKFEKIKALKTAFITDRLDLTATEAEKFWPVYNQYEKELHQLQIIERMGIMDEIRDNGGVNKLTDKDANTLVAKILDLDEQIHTTEKNKYTALKKVISSQKIIRLFHAEEEFKRELFRRLQEHREKGRP